MENNSPDLFVWKLIKRDWHATVPSPYVFGPFYTHATLVLFFVNWERKRLLHLIDRMHYSSFYNMFFSVRVIKGDGGLSPLLNSF